jgi:hypothetical protein
MKKKGGPREGWLRGRFSPLSTLLSRALSASKLFDPGPPAQWCVPSYDSISRDNAGRL